MASGDLPRELLLGLFAVVFCAAGAAWLVVPVLLGGGPSAARGPIRGLPLNGLLARVVVTIPAAGVGAVFINVGGRRVRLPAKNLDPGSIPVDEPVVIMEVEKRLVWIQALPSDLKEVFRCSSSACSY